jgi:hypothetical protein
MYLKNVYSIFKVQGGFVSPLTTQRTKKPRNSNPSAKKMRNIKKDISQLGFSSLLGQQKKADTNLK